MPLSPNFYILSNNPCKRYITLFFRLTGNEIQDLDSQYLTLWTILPFTVQLHSSGGYWLCSEMNAPLNRTVGDIPFSYVHKSQFWATSSIISESRVWKTSSKLDLSWGCWKSIGGCWVGRENNSGETGRMKESGYKRWRTKKNMTGKRKHILCLKIHLSPEKSKPLSALFSLWTGLSGLDCCAALEVICGRPI